MAIFSIVIEDNMIFEITNNFRNVLIVACGGCINESLAYTNKYPIFKTVNNKTKTYAVHLEAERIYKILVNKGHIVKVLESSEIKHFEFLCIRNKIIKFDLYDYIGDFKPDIILNLSCGAGTFGIVKSHGESVPIKQITESIGMLSYVYEETTDGQYMVHSKVKIISFDGRVVELKY